MKDERKTKEELGVELRALRQQLAGLESAQIQHKKTEEALLQRDHDLGERLKELDCLYSIPELINKPGISLNGILWGVVDVLPSAWQFPEITCARLAFESREFKTKNFRETRWRQASEILAGSRRVGLLEIYYLEERLQRDEGPFLGEERRLIDAIAEQLGKVIERRSAEEALSQAEARYRLLFNSGSDAVFVHQPEPGGKAGRFIEVNDITCQRYGYTREEFLTMTPLDLSAPENMNQFPERVKGLMDKRSILFETVQKTKGGREIPVEISSHLFELNRKPTVMSIVRDVSERKQVEKALKESEERYRNIFENIQDVYYEVSLEGDILEVSPSVEEVSRYKRAEALGKSLYAIYANPKDRDTYIKRLLKDGKVTDYEVLLRDKDGSQGYCSITAKLVRDEEGTPAKIIGSMRNINKRKRVEEALRESQLRYRTLFWTAPMGIGLATLDGRILECNDAMLKLIGHTELGVGQINIKDTYQNPEDRSALLKQLERDGFVRDFEVGLKRKDGKPYPALLNITKFILNGEEVLLTVAQDVSERKQAEEQIRVLIQQLIRAQEDERLRLSRYLHDKVAQDLSTLKIRCDSLIDNKGDAPAEMKRMLLQFSTILQETISEVRDLAYDLRPSILDQLGLLSAIHQHCEDFSERTGVNLDLYSAGMDGLKLDSDTEIHLYRLIQEALNNIREHAEASEVTIRLVASFPKIILRVEDDGKGFDVSKRLAAVRNERRMGLQNMAERVRLLQGKMRIQSQPGKGTKIAIELPGKENNGDTVPQYTHC